jgi:hypothetical protein
VLPDTLTFTLEGRASPPQHSGVGETPMTRSVRQPADTRVTVPSAALNIGGRIVAVILGILAALCWPTVRGKFRSSLRSRCSSCFSPEPS